jgi:prepilin-type N-terminal cleavage/methylation domain-containing protein
MRNQRGFSIVEMLIAMAVMLSITGAVFSIVNPSQGMFQSQTEVSDMQQRLRVTADTLYKDLVMAGGGSYQGQMSGSLLYTFAPVLPYRAGELNEDPPGTVKTDTLTVIYIPPTNAQTTLATNPGNSLTNSVETRVAPEAGCPAGDALCGFSEGMTVLIYDENGHSELFTITQIQDNNLNNIKIQHNGEKLSYPFPMNPSTKIVQASTYTYFLKTDVATSTFQLMRYDGGKGADVPVVDNVVGLSFRYFADPQPPQLNGSPLTDKTVPATTYGPRPPVVGTNNGDGWPDGENCVFMFAGPQLVPRLDVIGDGTTLVELAPAKLADGPWCPGPAGAAPGQGSWDADLLRVRKIQVTLRVQTALASLRGPASALFTYGGTSKEGTKWVPDQQMSFSVSPRNMNLGR